jgi:hypothetical protein
VGERFSVLCIWAIFISLRQQFYLALETLALGKFTVEGGGWEFLGSGGKEGEHHTEIPTLTLSLPRER